MSGATDSLRRTIAGAEDLKTVVRSMKALAASSISQYEKSVHALEDYYRTVELGLVACFRLIGGAAVPARGRLKGPGAIGAVVFGSDQGLVGRFNEVLMELVTRNLASLEGQTTKIWALGERVQALVADTGLPQASRLAVPVSVEAITPLVGQILIEIETAREKDGLEQVYLFHNRPKSGATYAPVSQRLLPLDDRWRANLTAVPWPTKYEPEVIGSVEVALRAFIRGYLFVTLFRACAESLASENASRLAAMERADRNIEERLGDLNRTYHRLRQESIDEELFDVVSGYEALSKGGVQRSGE